jgi:4-hydroxy-3-methylbut-2-enyl diphosphate reductase IspH
LAKVTGLAQTTLSVDDSSGTVQAIINDFTNWQFSTPRGVQDVTGVNKSAIERLLLLADFSVTLNGVFDPTANAAHDVFKTVPSTSVNRTTTITTNGKTLANEVLYTDYQVTRPQTGELTFQVPGVLADGTVPTWA